MKIIRKEVAFYTWGPADFLK